MNISASCIPAERTASLGTDGCIKCPYILRGIASLVASRTYATPGTGEGVLDRSDWDSLDSDPGGDVS